MRWHVLLVCLHPCIMQRHIDSNRSRWTAVAHVEQRSLTLNAALLMLGTLSVAACDPTPHADDSSLPVWIIDRSCSPYHRDQGRLRHDPPGPPQSCLQVWCASRSKLHVIVFCGDRNLSKTQIRKPQKARIESARGTQALLCQTSRR